MALYRDSVKYLNKMKEESGRLPEEQNYVVREILEHRRFWLEKIEELEASGILSQKMAAKFKNDLN